MDIPIHKKDETPLEAADSESQISNGAGTPPQGAEVTGVTAAWRPSQSMEALRMKSETPSTPTEAHEDKKGKSGIFGRALAISIYLTLFLTPLFFFFSSDTVGLSKHLLVLMLAFLTLAAWVAKIISSGEFAWRRTWLIWPAIGMFLVALLSALTTSSSTWISLLGDVGRYGFSAVSLLSYLIIFLAVLANFDSKNAFRGVLAIVYANIVLTIITLLQFFGAFIFPGEYAEQEAFNPIGSLFTLSLWLAFTFPLLIAASQDIKRRALKYTMWVGAVLNLVLLFAVNFKTAWLILALGMLAYIGMLVFRNGFSSSASTERQRMVMGVLVAVLAIIMWLVPNSPSIPIVEVPVEVSPSYRSSMNVLGGTWGGGAGNLFLGAGPEMYPYAYGQNKTAALNATNFWGVNFVDSNAEVITWMTTTGILGTIALVAFAVLVLWSSAKNMKRFDEVSVGIFALWFMILASKFLYPTAIPIEVMFWVLPALLIARVGAEQNSFKLKSGSAKTLVLFVASIILLVVAVGGLYLTGQRWIAEAHYTDVINDQVVEDNIEEKVQDTVRAIQLNPRAPRYYLALGQLLLARTQVMIGEISSRQGEERRATTEEAQLIQSLIAQALQSGEQAMRLDPENVATKITIGNMYSAVENIGLVDGAVERSIAVYEDAVRLEPVNPFLRTQLAQLYLIKGNFFTDPNELGAEEISKAKSELEKAIELSENYSNARYFYGIILDREGNRQGALTEFERIAVFNPNNEIVGLIISNLRAGRPALAPPVPAEAEEAPVQDEEGAQGIPEEAPEEPLPVQE